jgi:hypothetical protein
MRVAHGADGAQPPGDWAKTQLATAEQRLMHARQVYAEANKKLRLVSQTANLDGWAGDLKQLLRGNSNGIVSLPIIDAFGRAPTKASGVGQRGNLIVTGATPAVLTSIGKPVPEPVAGEKSVMSSKTAWEGK